MGLGRDYLADSAYERHQESPCADENTWVTKDGREIKIVDMEDSHLLNTIKYLKRTGRHLVRFGTYGSLAEDMYYDEDPSPVYLSLKAEAKRRGLN